MLSQKVINFNIIGHFQKSTKRDFKSNFGSKMESASMEFMENPKHECIALLALILIKTHYIIHMQTIIMESHDLKSSKTAIHFSKFQREKEKLKT